MRKHGNGAPNGTQKPEATYQTPRYKSSGITQKEEHEYRQRGKSRVLNRRRHVKRAWCGAEDRPRKTEPPRKDQRPKSNHTPQQGHQKPIADAKKVRRTRVANPRMRWSHASIWPRAPARDEEKRSTTETTASSTEAEGKPRSNSR
jgi:hypothetical protein